MFSDVIKLVDAIGTVGFPILLAIILCVFIYKIYTDSNKRHYEREEKLYSEIEANRKINSQAISTIALYAEKLEIIQEDVAEIKKDVIILTAQSNNK